MEGSDKNPFPLAPNDGGTRLRAQALAPFPVLFMFPRYWGLGESSLGMYTKEQFAKTIDNTLLRATSTREEVLQLCEESAARNFAAVCILPCWVSDAARALTGTEIKVCTVASFPLGAGTTAAKVCEAQDAAANGAQEVDVVMSVARFKSGDYDGVLADLRGVAEAVRGAALLKVIIETCYLTPDEIDQASRLVQEAGADFVKTSTGTAGGGATVGDIRRIRRALGASPIGIKASGGIKTVEAALQMLDAGASRIGTSYGAALYDAYMAQV